MNFEKEHLEQVLPSQERKDSEKNLFEEVKRETEETYAWLAHSPERQRAYGKNIELAEETVSATLKEVGYQEKIESLKKRFREALKAAAFAMPVLAASPAFAEEDQPREAVTEAQAPWRDAGERKEIFSDTVMSSQGALEAEFAADQKIETGAPELTPEAPPAAENEIEKAKREIFQEFGEKRLALFQEFATSLIAQGAGSPETQKKLLDLLGEEIKTGEIPMVLAKNFVPFFHGAKLLAEAVTGKKGEKQLSAFEQMKSFVRGLGSLAVDASQIGYIGKNVVAAQRVINTVDRTHATLNYAISAQEILTAVQNNKNNPYAQEVIGKVITMLQKKTIVEEGQSALEKKLQKIYEETPQDPSPFPKSLDETGTESL